jgi:putative chitinase
MKNQGITDPKDQIGVLATIGKESGFIPKSEYSYRDTSNDWLRTLFSDRLAAYDEAALNALKKDDVKFYDVIYGPNKWNKHTKNSGDGYRYRGRGFNGITYKATYEKYGELLGLDLINNPDLLNDPKIATKAAILMLKNGLKSYKKTY